MRSLIPVRLLALLLCWWSAAISDATPASLPACNFNASDTAAAHHSEPFFSPTYLNPDSGRFWTRDVFEGAPSDPLSLHKYLYAHASPLDYSDPSGWMTIAEAMTALKEHVRQRIPQGRAGRRAYETTKKTLCMGGRVAFTAAALYGGHHTFPKFLGGPEIQRLAKLSPDMHRILHQLLHMFVKDDPLLNELSALGGKSGSTGAWEEAMRDPAKAKRAIELLKKATQAVDKFCKFRKPTLTDELETML